MVNPLDDITDCIINENVTDKFWFRTTTGADWCYDRTHGPYRTYFRGWKELKADEPQYAVLLEDAYRHIGLKPAKEAFKGNLNKKEERQMGADNEETVCRSLIHEAHGEIANKRRELAKAYIRRRVAEAERARRIAEQLEAEVEALKGETIENVAQQAEKECYDGGDTVTVTLNNEIE